MDPLQPARIIATTTFSVEGFRIVEYLGIGYDASEIGDSATEVLCYGTAVRLEPLAPGA